MQQAAALSGSQVVLVQGSNLQDQLNFHRQEVRRIEQLVLQQQQMAQQPPSMQQFGHPNQMVEPTMNPIYGPSMMSTY